MRYKTALIMAVLVIPGVVHADMTAVYAAPNTPFQMTIEIATNGDVRGEMPMGNVAFLTQDGHGYIIEQGADGPVVSRVEDLATVATEQMAKLAPKFREELAAHATPMTFVLKGQVVINGRTGDAYYFQAPNGDLSPKPIVVISHDPALAPLGRAMATQFSMSMKLGGQMLPVGVFQPMLDILQKGAPLLFTGAELQSVSEAPVSATEFALPTQPLPLDKVRQRRMVHGPAAGS